MSSEQPDIYTGNFYLGLCLAVSSSVFIGSSFIVKKKGLQKLSVRAGSGGYGYLKEWLWWTGLILMAIGEGANFAAYAFAPATLVTPLGALSVLVSAVLASHLLSERLNQLGKIGCLVCLIGSTVIVLHAPHEQDVQTLDELASRLQQPAFICYVLLVVVVSVVLIFYVSTSYARSNPMVYVTITGAIGSLTVTSCQGIGVALRQTASGDNQLTSCFTWFLVMVAAVCICVQMVYLNRSLDVFSTAVVTPMLYVLFTACVILASSILFDELRDMSAPHTIGVICGFVTTVTGVYLLQMYKDATVIFQTTTTASDAKSEQQRALLPLKQHGYRNGIIKT